MKKLTKIMLSVAAALTIAGAMAVTAMAEDTVDTITGTYDNTTGLVTMDGVVGSGKSQTILVLDNNVAEGEEAEIAYINQIDNSGTFSTFYLESGLQSSAPVTYNIKIGGTDKSLQTGTLTIVQNTVTIVLGDVTQDNKANVQDITAIRKYMANRNKPGDGTGQTGVQKTKAEDGTTIVLGDVTTDSKANVQDITAIRKYMANRNKPGEGTGQTGVQVDVLAEASAE